MPRTPKPTNASEGTAWFGGEVERSRLTLRIFGDDLDPAEVTELLRVAPRSAGRKGDPILGPDGTAIRNRRTGAWIFTFKPDSSATIDEGVEAFLAELPAKPSDWQMLVGRFNVDIILDVFVKGVNQGFELPASLLGRLASLGVSFRVDIFCEPDPDQEAALEARLSHQCGGVLIGASRHEHQVLPPNRYGFA